MFEIGGVDFLDAETFSFDDEEIDNCSTDEIASGEDKPI